jgi:L-ascorbate metabolism protein UlaG (beta-lactamase superfamily)
MKIRRLGWAGIELTSADTTVVIDYIRTFGAVDALVRVADRELPAVSARVDVALVTHLHDDHTDPAAIDEALTDSGYAIRPRRVPAEGNDAVATAAAERGIAERDLRVVPIDPWETSTVGPFKLTALPAVDGFGDPQVSWLVEADGQCVFHGGDTIFHGSWWSIALRVPRIDSPSCRSTGRCASSHTVSRRVRFRRR